MHDVIKTNGFGSIQIKNVKTIVQDAMIFLYSCKNLAVVRSHLSNQTKMASLVSYPLQGRIDKYARSGNTTFLILRN